jgi:hypothetical protein
MFIKILLAFKFKKRKCMQISNVKEKRLFTIEIQLYF